MPQFARGAKPSPRYKLSAAIPFKPLWSPPPQFAIVPKLLSMWDNDKDGVCVTAEEAFAKAVASVAAGQPELFISDAEVIRWATAHGVLNGAELGQVMDWMAQSGFKQNGNTYNDGAKSVVDYSNESVLQAAITQGPVKLGISAEALPQTAGSMQGWYAVGGSPGQFPNLDHCTSLCGYGPAGWLYQQLGVTLPSALSASKTGYLHFTWSTIGFVDYAWLMSTVGEAWLRTPTTILPNPTPTPIPPTPGPGPGPTPLPPTPGPSVIDQVNAAFAAIEQKYARYPAMVRILKQVNAMVDSYLQQHPQHMMLVKGSIPQPVLDAISKAFDAACIMYPVYAPAIQAVKPLIMSLLGNI